MRTIEDAFALSWIAFCLQRRVVARFREDELGDCILGCALTEGDHVTFRIPRKYMGFFCQGIERDDRVPEMEFEEAVARLEANAMVLSWYGGVRSGKTESVGKKVFNAPIFGEFVGDPATRKVLTKMIEQGEKHGDDRLGGREDKPPSFEPSGLSGEDHHLR